MVVAILGVGSSALGAAPATASGKLFGIHELTSTARAPAVASMLSDLGARSHRWDLSWQYVEPRPPQNGVHSYSFSIADRLYAADLARGIRPLIVLMSAPKWAWGDDVPHGDQPFGMPPGAEHLDDWAAFVAAAARRYPQALGFEVWNEPDTWAYWGRGVVPIDPVAYTAVLTRAHSAVKSVNTSTPVVGGALAAYPSTLDGLHMSVDEFVGGMMRAGAAKYMDAISLHDYTVGPTPPGRAEWAIPPGWMRAALASSGVSLPIWITESGVSTTGPGAVSDQGQGQGLVELYRWFQAQPDMEALFVHRLYEHGAPLLDRELGYGLMRQDLWGRWKPKPAFDALRAVTHQSAPPATEPGLLDRLLPGLPLG